MSNLLQPQVQSALKKLVESLDGYHIETDILRAVIDEANLKKETLELCDAIDMDPFKQFDGISSQKLDQLKRLMTVTECERVRVGGNNARIHAVVTFPSIHNMQLTFLYERRPTVEGKGCHITYNIDLSFNFQQREKLLEVQVWSPTNAPSPDPAICVRDAFLEDNDEDGWEDINSDEDVGDDEGGEVEKVSEETTSIPDSDSIQATKRQRLSGAATDEGDHATSKSDERNENHEEQDDDRDKFVAFLDGEILQTFMESTNLLPMEEGTAFFLIMTFPFYEHEWDIVGFVLDEAFGGDDGDEMSH